MDKKLFTKALSKFTLGFLLVCALLFLSIPLILGSLHSFAVFCAYPFLLARRIRNEEAVLTRELPGYSDYKKKVKYKVLPLVW